MSALETAAAQSGDVTNNMSSGVGEPWLLAALLIGAFALGWLPVGWLTWRWRHERVAADRMLHLEQRASQAEVRAERIWKERDRLRRIVSGLTGELATLRRRLDQATAERRHGRGPDPQQAVDLEAALAGSLFRVAVLEEEVERLAGPDSGPPAAPLALVAGGTGHADDLQVIKGIGPKTEEALHGLDITTWEQIAAFTPDDIDRVAEAIGNFSGRIERDSWIEQARELIEQFPDPIGRPARIDHLDRTA